MSPRRRRARLAAPAAALAVIALASGCTGSAGSAPQPTTSPTASASSPSASSTEGPVTLRFAVYGDPQVVASYRAQARAFTQKRPNVTIKVETVSDQATAQEQLDRQFLNGTAPDLFLSDAGALPALASAARVQPVDEMLEKRGISFGDKYERLGLEAFAANSALQCMPTDVSPAVVFYNKRLLRPADLVEPGQPSPTPETGWRWPDFVKAAQQMSGGGVKGVYLAPELTTLAPLLRSAGADIVDDEVKPTSLSLSDSGSRSALEEILAVARNPRITPTPAELDRKDALTRFQDGRLGMIIGTRALVPVLRATPGLDFDVYPLPSLGRAATVADVSGYCVSRTSKHIDDAVDFLAFASSDEGAAITAESGGVVPANLATLHSPAFEQKGRQPQNTDVFASVMRRADTMPNPPAWPDVVSQTQPLLDRLFYARVLDLDVLLPRIDKLSAALMAGPTPSPSPTPSP